ncbi:hypothetical protein Zm00014a_028486 [Zea mays]|uniref:FLZ-type domain-containing protein n=1 Tax=Zea mays TaxID=4577 RepID=A0A3L6FA24_MAIZE|nr:hypothetical protein Zm00014a_028486 [Zea mays]
MEPAERIESGTALGKRPRSRALPRTPSMVTVPSAAKQGRQERRAASLPAAGTGTGAAAAMPVGYCYYYGGSFAAVETAAFLKACGRCSRRLGPGHDTFIYRGEVAFCSQECREKRIEYDERMEKTCCSLTSIKEAPAVSGASGSDQSGSGGETVAAA